MSSLITDITQVTPEWLSGVLRENGRLPQGEAVNVTCTKQKKTFTSTVTHLEASYSVDTPQTAPRRLFLKMSRSPAEPGDFDEDHFRKEVDFYTVVALAMPHPSSIPCNSAVYSSEEAACHLLLDDVAQTHFQTEHPLPPSDDQCERAINRLAQFHAFWWDHPRLGKDIGDFPTRDERKKGYSDAQKHTHDFMDFLGDRLSTARRDVYDAVLEALPHLSERQQQMKNITLVHGDAHLWNFVFPRDRAANDVYMIDWQFWHPTIGGTDLAFMIAREWYPERRRRLEERLIKQYHRVLLECGVTGYDWIACWRDYRLSVIQVSLFIPVWQWSLFKAGPGWWWSGLERAMLAFEDLQCTELLVE